MYAILCDARRGAETGIKVLARVDRHLTRTAWWTPDRMEIVQVFHRPEAAAEARDGIRLNNPRVVRLERARRAIEAQAAAIRAHAALPDGAAKTDLPA